MTLLFRESNLQAARTGEINLECATVTYTGNESSMPVSHLQARGWPGQAPLSAGLPQIALVPDSGRALAWLENQPNVDVSYDPADTAKVMVRSNYLPAAVFGRNAIGVVQDVMFDHLNAGDNEFTYRGIREQDMEDNRRQLREIAGLGAEHISAGKDPAGSIQTKLFEKPRADLQDAVNQLGAAGDDELEIDAAIAGKRDLVDVLVDHEPADVWDALDEVPDDEPVNEWGAA